jgi:hypothetical protein
MGGNAAACYNGSYKGPSQLHPGTYSGVYVAGATPRAFREKPWHRSGMDRRPSPPHEIMRPRAPLNPLGPEQAAEADRLLDRLGVPAPERADFLDALAALAEVALEAHLKACRSQEGGGGPRLPRRNERT